MNFVTITLLLPIVQPPWRCWTWSLQRALGTDEFLARLRKPFRGKEALKEVPRAQRYAARPSLAEIFGEKKAKSGKQKDEIMYRAYVEHGYRVVEIAEYLAVHYATISRAIRRGERLGMTNARM